jgi:hypothetical protein
VISLNISLPSTDGRFNKAFHYEFITVSLEIGSKGQHLACPIEYELYYEIENNSCN